MVSAARMSRYLSFNRVDHERHHGRATGISNSADGELRTANCDNATIPAHQLASLLDLALHTAGTHISLNIKRLQKKTGKAEEVELTVDEIRLILNLALRAKLLSSKSGRSILKVVPSSPKRVSILTTNSQPSARFPSLYICSSIYFHQGGPIRALPDFRKSARLAIGSRIGQSPSIAHAALPSNFQTCNTAHRWI